MFRRALEWELGDRGDASLKKLVQKIDDGKCNFVTNEWGGFFRTLQESRHFFGKGLTFAIEGTNRDIRHRLARFKRRTKSSSRSVDNGSHVFISFSLFPRLSREFMAYVERIFIVL